MIVNHPQSAQYDPWSREEIGAGLSELHIVAALVERHGNSRHSSGDSNPACSERGTSSQGAAGQTVLSACGANRDGSQRLLAC